MKPFIYYFAKKNGIDNSEKFDADKNSLDWKVREASFVNSKLNIDAQILQKDELQVSSSIGLVAGKNVQNNF